MDKSQLNIIKSYNSPPNLVVMILSACCLIFGHDETWESAKRCLKIYTKLGCARQPILTVLQFRGSQVQWLQISERKHRLSLVFWGFHNSHVLAIIS